MEYKLALELKNAGFPQTGEIGDWFYVNQELDVICAGNGYECDCPLTTYDIENPYERKIVKAPKLEELIEACGDKFENLTYGNDFDRVWYCNAIGNGANHILDGYETKGSTPLEAVARLYLAIKK